jgi:hypothetical protein
MQFWTKETITHHLAGTKAQVSIDKQRLREIWLGLLRSEDAMEQARQAFLTSRALLERLPTKP